MKGLHNVIPPKPRYIFTWDVLLVLNYLKGLFPLEDLTLKQLTLKTTAFTALAVAPRAQTLQSMCLNNMFGNDSHVLFRFPEGLKTSRYGHSYILKLDHYGDERLCAFHTLLHYIEKTKSESKCSCFFCNLQVSYYQYHS